VEFVGFIVFAVVVYVLWRRHAAGRSAPTRPTAAPRPPKARAQQRSHATQPAPRPPIHTQPRPTGPARETGSRFAQPHTKGDLFTYGGPSTGRAGEHTHAGPYAVIDVETTGFSPAKGDRVIEIAIARVDAKGRIEDEYATLLNPQGRDTGAVFVHGISNDAVWDAPTFADVAGEILSRLDGAVVVAHNAAFEERFLAAEFARAGVAHTSLPALCSLWLGQRTFSTPNHKLATLAQHAGVPLVDAHAALGDVRAVAALLPTMLQRHGPDLAFGLAPRNGLGALWPTGVVTPRTRAVELRKGTQGWMQSLMARLPLSGADVTDADADRYLDALLQAVSDGRIVADEAKYLAALAGAAGMGAAQVAALNERLLEVLREAALADGVLTVVELKQLTTVAKALSVPDYFDDLSPTATQPTTAAVGATITTAVGAPNVRRCGHCRQPGHNRTTCSELKN
jgi:DNA polymerase III epsilon subunit-like protein